MTRHQGTVTDWNDARGFGFIAPVTGGPRVLVHVSAFPRGRRPAIHDLVTYGVAPDARNRLRASGVQFVGRSRSDRRGTAALPVALVAATSFLGALVGFVALGEAPLLLLAPYGAFSLIAFEMYRADKIAAGRRGWRISQANLHAAAWQAAGRAPSSRGTCSGTRRRSSPSAPCSGARWSSTVARWPGSCPTFLRH